MMIEAGKKGLRQAPASAAGAVAVNPCHNATARVPTHRGLRRSQDKEAFKYNSNQTPSEALALVPSSAAAGAVDVKPSSNPTRLPTYRGLRKVHEKEHHAYKWEQTPSEAVALVSSCRHGRVPLLRGLHKNRDMMVGRASSTRTESLMKDDASSMESLMKPDASSTEDSQVNTTQEASDVEESISSLSESVVGPSLRQQRPPKKKKKEGLVVAVPVAADDLPLYEADMVDPEELERQALQQQRRKKKNCCYWGFTFLFPVGAVLLVFGFFVLRRQNNDAPTPATTATPSPTAVMETPPPTIFETLSIEEYVRSLLPSDSLRLIDKPKSPQSQAFRWVVEDPLLPNFNDLRIRQRFALAVLYYALGGEETWFNDTNWLSYHPHIHECDWFANHWDVGTNQQHSMLNLTGRGHASELVYLAPMDVCRSINADEPAAGQQDKDNRRAYRELWLQTNGLKGKVPDELYLLTHLKVLNLGSGNVLRGTLSSMIGNLQELEAVSFSSCQLKSKLPSELGLLQNLSVFSMSANQVTGTVPSELFLLTNLQHLWLEENKLTGSIAPQIGQLSQLETLYLFSNGNLTGSLPTEIGSLTSMKELSLRNNNILGSIPTEVGLMSDLTVLFLSKNNFTSSLPSEVGQLQNMRDFQIVSSGLQGTIPTQLGLLSSMTNLYLFSNALRGAVPSELGLVKTLIDLEMHWNQLSSVLPTELGSLASLKWLWLFANKLTGPIPSETSMLSSITDFSLFDNRLSRTIPTELAMLTSMEHLWLSNNKLTGPIPSELGECTSLKSINLYNNSLTSTLPTELSTDLEALTTLDVRFNRELSGTVPTSFCSITDFDCSLQLCGCHCHCTNKLDLQQTATPTETDQATDAPFIIDTNHTLAPNQTMPANASSSGVAFLDDIQEDMMNQPTYIEQPPEELELEQGGGEMIGPYEFEFADAVAEDRETEQQMIDPRISNAAALKLLDKWIFD